MNLQGGYVPTEDFCGCSRQPVEGGSIEIRLVEKWDCWHATIAIDGARLEFYGRDYDTLLRYAQKRAGDARRSCSRRAGREAVL